MQPTSEQQAIIDAAKSTTDNILISALAGSAKTTTLEMIAKALTQEPILSVAFNKKIADEMAKRLPPHVVSKTINALGHGIWYNATGRKLVIDTKKNYNLWKEVFETLKGSDKRDTPFAEILQSISRAKNMGYIPPSHVYANRSLVTRDQFAESFDEEPEPFWLDLIDQVMNKSIAESYRGNIDFDDQVYCSALLGGTFPRYPLVLVDETQDLSLLNHAFLQKLVAKRIIAVGDRNQAIYAFRGALSNSMDELKRSFSMTEKTLTISFRCPRSVVREAQTLVPSMQWPEWAIEGEVRHWGEWNSSSIPEGAAVICRANAPLFRLAMSLLRQGRGCTIVGRDIGPGLIKTLKGLGSEQMDQASALKAIAKWEAEKKSKSRAKASIEDRAESLRVFVAVGKNLSEAITYADHLFKQEGPVLLMTGHKAKGLEYDDVIFLDSWRIPSKWAESEEDIKQEQNISYVIMTRAKKTLTYANLDSFVEEQHGKDWAKAANG